MTLRVAKPSDGDATVVVEFISSMLDRHLTLRYRREESAVKNKMTAFA